MHRIDLQLSDRAKWVLRLLYAPTNNGSHEPMYGRTRIVKAMFLVQRKLQEEFNIDTGFEFKAYKYGPFDKGVFEASEDLEQKGLIRTIPEEEHNSIRDQPKYVLTDKGVEKGSELWENLDGQQKKLLRWVRYEQASRPMGSLLSYVYRNYPDMTTESEIADRFSNHG